jgi:hypothetical protein
MLHHQATHACIECLARLRLVVLRELRLRRSSQRPCVRTLLLGERPCYALWLRWNNFVFEHEHEDVGLRSLRRPRCQYRSGILREERYLLDMIGAHACGDSRVYVRAPTQHGQPQQRDG